jgi:hypothetical protein
MRTGAATTRRKNARIQSHRRFGLRIQKRVMAVVAQYPKADPDTIRHTLILLSLPPLERLQRSLIRGRAAADRS